MPVPRRPEAATVLVGDRPEQGPELARRTWPARAPAAERLAAEPLPRSRSGRRRTDRTESPARLRRGIGRTRPALAGLLRAAPPVVASQPAAARQTPPLADSRSSNRSDSGASSGCRTWDTACPVAAGGGARTRSSALPVEQRRRRSEGDSRSRGKTRGLPGCQRRSDRTSRTDGTPLVRTSQEDFC